MHDITKLHSSIERHITEFDLATDGLYRPRRNEPVHLKPQVCDLLDQYANVQGIGRDLAANELLRMCLEGE